jgi:arsenite-transporting ATPase
LENLKRLYIFTGKGGVGKTTCALAFTKYLKGQNKKVLYSYIKSTNINNSIQNNLEVEGLGIDTLGLELREAATEYVSMKMKSKIIGPLVTRAPFFKSLVSMIPGFNYVIYLGHIIHLLENDPELIVVFDSPSSGHALTMLRSSYNFSEIFKSGVLYEDTQKMITSLNKEDFIGLIVMAIPTSMALKEAKELSQELLNISNNFSSKVILNNYINIDKTGLPDSIKNKVENETKVIEENSEFIDSKIPHCTKINKAEIVKDTAKFIKNLV